MEDEVKSVPPLEVFDDDFARDLIGKSVLVHHTYRDHNGVLVRRSQVFGRVVRAERAVGIFLRGENDEHETSLPPDTRAFYPAAPGSYRNWDTGEVVKDPDFLASWTATAVPPES